MWKTPAIVSPPGMIRCTAIESWPLCASHSWKSAAVQFRERERERERETETERERERYREKTKRE